MGVLILGLKRWTYRTLRIGSFLHKIGLIAPLWKVTETDLADGRLEHLEALDAAERMQGPETPKAVMVEAAVRFGLAADSAHLVLGWDLGRLQVQDYDWDHLPTLGYAVRDAAGEFVLHGVGLGSSLVQLTTTQAQELGILSADGQLVRRGQPTIVACRSVERMVGGCFLAECEFDDGRSATVVGETESGDLPPPRWLIGKTPKDAASYRLASQTAFRG